MGHGVAVLNLQVLLIGLQMLAVCCAPVPNTFTVYLQPKDLKKGAKMPFYLAKEDFSRTRFLAREEADSIPFSSRHLREIHSIFAGSPMASYIDDTISMCEQPPIKGETKFCATSLESMLDFVVQVFGTNNNNNNNNNSPSLLTTSFRFEHGEVFQNYTIAEEPEEIVTAKMVGCHTVAYPYSVAYCHSQQGGNKAFKLLLRGENGDLVDLYVACHLDTSLWDPNFRGFVVLGTRPGDPLCHVFPPHGNFLWILNPDNPTTTTALV